MRSRSFTTLMRKARGQQEDDDEENPELNSTSRPREEGNGTAAAGSSRPSADEENFFRDDDDEHDGAIAIPSTSGGLEQPAAAGAASAGNLLPSTTSAWFAELGNESADADALFSGLVDQLADTINTTATTDPLASTAAGAGAAASSTSASDKSKNKQLRAVAEQTRKILQETTEQLHQEQQRKEDAECSSSSGHLGGGGGGADDGEDISLYHVGRSEDEEHFASSSRNGGRRKSAGDEALDSVVAGADGQEDQEEEEEDSVAVAAVDAAGFGSALKRTFAFEVWPVVEEWAVDLWKKEHHHAKKGPESSASAFAAAKSDKRSSSSSSSSQESDTSEVLMEDGDEIVLDKKPIEAAEIENKKEGEDEGEQKVEDGPEVSRTEIKHLWMAFAKMFVAECAGKLHKLWKKRRDRQRRSSVDSLDSGVFTSSSSRRDSSALMLGETDSDFQRSVSTTSELLGSMDTVAAADDDVDDLQLSGVLKQAGSASGSNTFLPPGATSGSEARNMIASGSSWHESKISWRALLEICLLYGIDVAGLAQPEALNTGDNEEQQALLAEAGAAALEADFGATTSNSSGHFNLAGAAEAFSGGEQNDSNNCGSSTITRPDPAATAGTAAVLGQSRRRRASAVMVYEEEQKKEEAASAEDAKTNQRRKNYFSFLEVLTWLRTDPSLAEVDPFARLKVRLRAHGCKSLNSKTIADVYSVFSKFDADGGGTLDADELEQLFLLLADEHSAVDSASLAGGGATAGGGSGNDLESPSDESDDDDDDDGGGGDADVSSIDPETGEKRPSRLSAEERAARSEERRQRRVQRKQKNIAAQQQQQQQQQQQDKKTIDGTGTNSNNSSVSRSDIALLMKEVDPEGTGIDFERILLLLGSDGFGEENVDEEDAAFSNEQQLQKSANNYASFYGKNNPKIAAAAAAASNSEQQQKKSNARKSIREAGLDHKLMAAFRKHDPMRTGYITVEDLKKTIRSLTVDHMSEGQIEEVAEMAHTRGDGYIEYGLKGWPIIWSCARGDAAFS